MTRYDFVDETPIDWSRARDIRTGELLGLNPDGSPSVRVESSPAGPTAGNSAARPIARAPGAAMASDIAPDSSPDSSSGARLTLQERAESRRLEPPPGCPVELVRVQIRMHGILAFDGHPLVLAYDHMGRFGAREGWAGWVLGPGSEVSFLFAPLRPARRPWFAFLGWLPIVSAAWCVNALLERARAITRAMTRAGGRVRAGVCARVRALSWFFRRITHPAPPESEALASSVRVAVGSLPPGLATDPAVGASDSGVRGELSAPPPGGGAEPPRPGGRGIHGEGEGTAEPAPGLLDSVRRHAMRLVAMSAVCSGLPRAGDVHPTEHRARSHPNRQPKGPSILKVKSQPYVIVRTYSAGVHFGEVHTPLCGKEITLRRARRVWSWVGANTLHELALHGPRRGSRISEAVPWITLTEAIEIIECSADAGAAFEASSWPK